ncbi:response regulator [Candidatus Parcubacteria bacterium]|nr:MAG: response regulator [Candidatus Parcubacteria bacterium]
MAKLLIIEDDPFLLGILAEKIKEGGFDIDTAMDGEDGLNKIRKEKYDLILTDMVLPKNDGFKILEEMHSSEELKKIPVLVLSNLYDKNNIDKAILLGARDYIVKAYHTPEEIVLKVKTFITKEGI